MSCNSFNVIYVVIWIGCLEECIGETDVWKIRLRDTEGQSIQTTHKATRALTIKRWGKYMNLWKMPFQNIPISSDVIKWHKFKKRIWNIWTFQTEYINKLNQLWQIRGMTQVCFIENIYKYRWPFPCWVLYCVTEGMSMFEAIENDQHFKFSAFQTS